MKQSGKRRYQASYEQGFGIWELRVADFEFDPRNGIFAFGMKKNGLLGPKIGLLSFSKKSEKNVTPHYFWYNLVKFCTIVKCYTISES